MAKPAQDDDGAAQYYAAQNAARDRRRRVHTAVAIGILTIASVLAFNGGVGAAIRFSIITGFLYTVGVILEGLTRRIR